MILNYLIAATPPHTGAPRGAGENPSALWRMGTDPARAEAKFAEVVAGWRHPGTVITLTEVTDTGTRTLREVQN